MTTTTKTNAVRLVEMRPHQVYRLERRQRSLLSRLSHGLRARLHR